MSFRRLSSLRALPRAARRLLAGALFAVGLGPLPAQGAAGPFGMAQVVSRARSLAARPYEAPPTTPARFTKLDFSRWREIRSRSGAALWRNDGLFQVEFLPAGYLYQYKIQMNVVDGTGVHRVESSPRLFQVDEAKVGTPVTPAIGFAGVRLLYPNNEAGRYDEVLSFLGASYFRALGRGNAFGLSARGIAIDAAGPGVEEFPLFREFWLCKPAPSAKRITIYALLDGPSVSGAYRFVIGPGRETVVDVEGVLFPRRRIAKLGLAPLSSMFLYGAGDPRPPGHRFPAVHDSDGLLIQSGSGQWIWRPLENPRGVLDDTFPVGAVQGFGLMQRDRDPKHYADDGLHYARRPSVWITPMAPWPKGRVELVAFHSPDESNDNVAAFWRLDEPAAPGDSLRFSYRIHWQGAEPQRSTLGRVVASRVGPGPGAETGSKKVVVDFAGGPLRDLPIDAVLESVLEPGGARILERRVRRDARTGGWRLVFVLGPQGEKPNRVRATLTRHGTPVTETWDYPVDAMTGSPSSR